MGAYIVRRLIQAVFIVLLVTIIVFFVMRTLPGDPVLVYVGNDFLRSASPEEIAEVRHQFGLDKPVIVQYVNWLGDIVHADLGTSIINRVPVVDEISRALPKTLFMGSIAFILSIILGIPLGVIAAVRRGKWADTLSTIIANIGVTAPIFWVGIILVLIFSLKLDWLPVQGYISPFENLGESIRHVILPVICLTVYPMSAAARQTRSAMLEVIRQDYIRTAWSKGLTERKVIIRHAIRNAIIPVITLIGMNIRQIIGGSVLIEKVFNIPGMGRLSVDALFDNDYAVVQGVILVVAIAVVLSNLLVDISYGWIDPRVRYE
jgi:peptide/nickel transport system permease protein